MPSINACLEIVYAGETGQTEWKTFLTPAAIGQSEPTESGSEFFPVSYLFHAGQVADAEGNPPAAGAVNLFAAALRQQPLALPAPGDRLRHTMNPPNYEQKRQSRADREAREAARLKLTVRGVARVLGGRYLDAESEHAGHTIELAPTVHLWARRDWRKRDAIHWGVRCPLVSLSNVPSVRTAVARPVAAIAADVRRRLIPAAHAACRSAPAMTNGTMRRDSASRTTNCSAVPGAAKSPPRCACTRGTAC